MERVAGRLSRRSHHHALSAHFIMKLMKYLITIVDYSDNHFSFDVMKRPLLPDFGFDARLSSKSK